MILLDTHALVWWATDPGRLPAKAARLIDTEIRAATPVLVSSISVWELAMLIERKRLRLVVDAADWLERIESVPHIDFVPVDNAIAVRAVRLEKFPHRDPADRIIAATALLRDATLLTADTYLRRYRAVRTAWD